MTPIRKTFCLFLLLSLFFYPHAFSEQQELELNLSTCLSSKDDSKKEEPVFFAPDQLASLTSDATQLIGGIISPLSGNPCLKETDFIVTGAQEIVLNRVYVAPYMPYTFHKHWDADCYYRRNYLSQHYEGWKYFPHIRLWINPQKNEVHLTNSNGAAYDFSLAKGKTSLMQPYAASNMGDLEIPSGRFDPKNTRITYDGNNATVFSPNGSIRHYTFKSLSGRTLLLQKEVLPNGKIIRYQYDNRRLSTIESLDPKERYVYASINMQGAPYEGNCKFTSSTGLNSSCYFEKSYYKGKFRDRGYKISYDGYTPHLMTKSDSPQYRRETVTYTSPFCLLESFSGKEKAFSLSQTSFGEGDKAHFRVDKLLLPVGQKDDFVPVYQMTYQPAIAGEKEGKTTVKNIDGTSTVYQFSKNLLTKLIQYFSQDGTLKREKIFTWNDKSWLTSVELRDGNKRLFLKKIYDYDQYGNPVTETLIGDLQGNGTEDTYKIKREFSQNGRNLLLKEETEEGKCTTFEYLPNTNLVTLKLIKDRDHLLIREAFQYDDCHNLIRKSTDDGNLQKMITDYILRQQQPFLHMPEWIEEKYLENGIEKLLKRTHLAYDQWGHVAEEKIYDSNGEYAYSIFKEYNERGNLLSETNQMGQKQTFVYDDKGHRVVSTNFSGRLQEKMHYDKKGRLRECVLIGVDGIEHATTYTYDSNDNLIKKVDAYGNPFSYAFDPLVRKTTKSTLPSILNAEGLATPVIETSTYDALGREISKTDANGYTIFYRYNAYSLPIEITYPNGSKEVYGYTKSGKLASYTDREGLTTHYTVDVLNRITSKDYGKAIGKENFFYDSFNLVKKIGLEGTITRLLYDGARRKIQEEISGHVINYNYDPLGRIEIVSQDSLRTHFKRDLEGQILEESKTDTAGIPLYKISYAYNDDGDLANIIRYIDGKEAVDIFIYDAFRREVEYQDPYGNKILTTYNENHVNKLGQKVLQITTIDPKGVMNFETHDPFFHLVKEETRSPQGTIIAGWDKVFDSNGNVTHWKEHVYKEGIYQNTQCTYFNYTNDNKVANNIRGFGTSDPRTISYTYTPGGKVAVKTLPNGVSLSYYYDTLGFLRSLSSSDGKIKHKFECTKTGELICACDEVENIIIHRELDPFGNVTRELFPNNIEIKKNYDLLDRLTSLQITNIGSISYTYDPLYLKSVSRYSPDGKIQYTHQYESYDLDGNLLSEIMIFNAGKVKRSMDLKGRKTEISSPYFIQKCNYDVGDNLIKSAIDCIETSYTHDDLSQLTSENDEIYGYDSLYNRRKKDEQNFEVNGLNELSNEKYDLNGNQIQKGNTHYAFDALNRLIEATCGNKEIHFLYDPLGRLLTKILLNKTSAGLEETWQENYLYDGQQEIGALTQEGALKNLKVPGLSEHKDTPLPIAIEINKNIFSPIIDVQGNICRLVDPHSKIVKSQYEFTAFGETKSAVYDENPWRYAAKRFDSELNLINFGKRYYDPELARWLSTDPAGFVDSLNLYQYAFNNPYCYYDPNGEFIWAVALPFAYFFGPAIAKACLDAVIIGVVSWGAYKGTKYAADYMNSRYRLSEDFCYDFVNNASNNRNSSTKMERNKKKDKEKNYPGSAKDLEKNPDWRETTHPGEAKSGRRVFENTKTGEQIEYDKGRAGEHGHKASDHYHRQNPNSKGKGDEYLDKNGNPCPKGSPQSHLYPPEGTSWL